jgi:hypothetical protein
MAALIGANGQRVDKILQRFIGPSRKRLFQHRHADIRQQLTALGQAIAAPGFVGIHDERCLRNRFTNGNQPLANQMIVELHFQQRGPFLPQRRRAGRHLVRRADNHRLRRNHPVGQRHAQQLRDALTRAARLTVPERAVHGVTRGPGGSRC